MDKIAEKIKNELKLEVSSADETLEKYSQDASLFKIRPQAVVFPKDTEELKNLVRWTVEENKKGNKISLTVRSGGTDMSGGALSESVVVDMAKYFNHFKGVEKNTAVTEPGVFYRDFEKETLKQNLLLPTYPSSREICTMGGMLANNSAGEKTLTYGKTEDYVEEMKMVTADGEEHVFKSLTPQELAVKEKIFGPEGEIYSGLRRLIQENRSILREAKPKVSKNSAGYFLWNVEQGNNFDLTRLITGSQGTFGIITEIKFRLIIPKKHSRLLVIFLKDTSRLAEIIKEVLNHRPESFESYDDHTFKIALRFFPDIAHHLKGNVLKLAFKFLPEFFMMLRGGIPKMVMLAEFTGDSEEEALGKAREADESLKKFSLDTKVTPDKKAAEKYWAVRRESFNLLRHRIKGRRTAPFIDDIIVLPEKLPEFLPRLYKTLNEYPSLIYTVAGHIGNGNFHIIPLMDMTKPESKKIIKELGGRVYELVLEFKGSFTAEHNDGLIRGPYLEKMYGSKVVSLFEETKKIFDPLGIFNPGKKTKADFNYTLSKIGE